MKLKTKVVAILGPTGVGKSAMGINVAKKFNGEIISADSVQIFKEFDIGSAKINQSQMQTVKHYAIDIVRASENFTAYDFVIYAKETIDNIVKQGKLPIIVGGTALYVKALLENYNLGATKNEDLRHQLQEQLNEKGLDFLSDNLKKLAPDEAEKIDLKNPQRVIRALEIVLSNQNKTKQESPYDYKIFALNRDREELYKIINSRVDEMFEQGLEKEVRLLLEKYGDSVQPFKAIGYKEFLPYFKGEYSQQQLINLIKQHSRNYAKRQLTFIRGMQNVSWIDVKDKIIAQQQIEKEIELWLH